MDDGHAISFMALRRGTIIRSCDGVELGTVRRVQNNVRENIFDGIVMETREGKRFIDAPEVAHIAERAVTLTITAAEAAQLPEPPNTMAERMKMMTTTRRAKRFSRDIKNRWDNR